MIKPKLFSVFKANFTNGDVESFKKNQTRKLRLSVSRWIGVSLQLAQSKQSEVAAMMVTCNYF